MTQLPTLPGVETRRFRGAEDYPHLARIITAWSRGMGDDRVETAEGIASGYENLERCDPDRDIVVVELDGRPSAYCRVWWAEEAGGPHLYQHVSFGTSPPSTTPASSSSRSGRTIETSPPPR